MLGHVLNVLEVYQTAFQINWIILHSHRQCLWFPLSPRTSQHLSLSVFCTLLILEGVKWYPVILIYIYLMANDVEHCFIFLLAICIFWGEKHLFKRFAHFKLEFCLFIIELKEFFMYSRYRSISDIQFAKLFSHSVGHIVTFLTVLFIAPKSKSWWSTVYLLLILVLWLSLSYLKILCQIEDH